MAFIRKNIMCDYCGVQYNVKFDQDETGNPDFCAFCGETLEDETDDEDED